MIKSILIIMLIIATLQSSEEKLNKKYYDICDSELEKIRDGSHDLELIKSSCSKSMEYTKKYRNIKDVYTLNLIIGMYKYVLLLEKPNIEDTDPNIAFVYAYANILKGNIKKAEIYMKMKKVRHCTNMNVIFKAIYPNKKKYLSKGLELCNETNTRHTTLEAHFKYYKALMDKKSYKEAKKSLDIFASKQKEFDIYYKSDYEIKVLLAIIYSKNKQYQKSQDIYDSFVGTPNEDDYTNFYWILYNYDMLGDKKKLETIENTKSFTRDFKLGKVYCNRLNQYEDGVKYLDKAYLKMIKDDRATMQDFLSLYEELIKAYGYKGLFDYKKAEIYKHKIMDLLLKTDDGQKLYPKYLKYFYSSYSERFAIKIIMKHIDDPNYKKEDLTNIFIHLASLYGKSKYDQSVYYYTMALNSLPPEKTLKDIFSGLIDTYKVCHKKAKKNIDYDKAIYCKKKEISIISFRMKKSKNDMGVDYYRLAQLYQDNANYDKALQSFKKAVNLFIDAQKGEVNLQTTYEVIKKIYIKYEDKENTLKYAHLELETKQKILKSSDLKLAFLYFEISEIYASMKNYEEAINYHRKIEPFIDKSTKTTILDTADYYRLLANLYAKNKQDAKSIEYYNKYFKYLKIDTKPFMKLEKSK